MQKLKKDLTFILPTYAMLPLICLVAINMICYVGSRYIAAPWQINPTTSLDEMIPVINAFVIIYIGCYIFWIVGYIRIARETPEICYHFVISEVIAKLICGLFFVFLPTVRIRPEVIGNDFCASLMRFVYDIDAPTNLFPSVHCLVSYFCWRGLFWCPKAGRGIKIYSFIAALAVFASTVLTAQHVLLDIVGAVLVSELAIFLADHFKIWQFFYKKCYLSRKENIS